jgi:hypothetical protein
MKTHQTLRQLIAATAAAMVISCSSTDVGVVRSIDRSKPLENARYWRQVNREPASFVPAMMARGAPTGSSHGRWVTDPQDQTRYFVPNYECGGIPPGAWEGEARKVTNRWTREEQRRHNVKTMLVDGPVEFGGMAIIATLIGLGSGG